MFKIPYTATSLAYTELERFQRGAGKALKINVEKKRTEVTPSGAWALLNSPYKSYFKLKV